MKKRILLTLAAIAAVAVGVVGMSAFEAHVINVTAHIENALSLDTYGIDFGTVFPQENVTDKGFAVGLSKSFLAQDRANEVAYKIVQKDKAWTLNFGGEDVDTHNRSLLCADPDTSNLAGRCVIANNVLTITTDSDKGAEDLFGANEIFGDVTAPRMVIPMGGNFTIETKVTADSQNYYQGGGILVYGSDGNAVRLEITNWSDGGNNTVYMESQENKVKVGKAWAMNVLTTDSVYLKLTRTGDEFKGYYSTDGSSWTSVPVQTPSDFNNPLNYPKVGLSAISSDPGNPAAFSAMFDYITFNGDYLSLCRFLSKDKVAGENDNNDVSEPSYFMGYQEGCYAVGQKPVEQATGILNQNDSSDSWTVDLKVPPVSGYVAQDWPESCTPWVVEEDAMDYGCDLWIEVTSIDGEGTEEGDEEREVNLENKDGNWNIITGDQINGLMTYSFDSATFKGNLTAQGLEANSKYQISLNGPGGCSATDDQLASAGSNLFQSGYWNNWAPALSPTCTGTPGEGKYNMDLITDWYTVMSDASGNINYNFNLDLPNGTYVGVKVLVKKVLDPFVSPWVDTSVEHTTNLFETASINFTVN